MTFRQEWRGGGKLFRRQPAGTLLRTLLSSIVLCSVHVLPASSADSPYPPGKGRPLTRLGPVTVHHAPGEAALARRVAARAETLHRRVRNDLGLENEIEVDLLLLTPRLPEEVSRPFEDSLAPWLAGAAYSNRRFIVLRLKPGQSPADLDSLLAHELTHVILQGDYPLIGGWPRWFQEGLAMRESGGEGLRRGAVLSFAVLRHRLLPLDELWGSFPDNEAGSRPAYAQSFSVVSFLHHRYGEARFHSFMESLRTTDFEDAFSKVYGTGLGAMEKGWRRYVQRRYNWIPLLTGGTAFWMLIVITFFAALAVRRRRDRMLREKWEEEENPRGDASPHSFGKKFPDL